MAIISLSGLAGSGKDTAAKILVEEYGFTRISFSGKVKDVVAAIFNWDRGLLEGLTDESRKWRDTIDPWWSNQLDTEVTPRWAMTEIGTEVMRKHFHQDIWVLALSRIAEDLKNKNQNVVVSDTRHINELYMMYTLGATLVGIHRKMPRWTSFFYAEMSKRVNVEDIHWRLNEDRTELREIVHSVVNSHICNVHVSECEHLVWPAYDRIIPNTGSLSSFRTRVRELASSVLNKNEQD